MTNTTQNSKSLTKEQENELFKVLKPRFEKNMNRHKNLQWTEIERKLISNPRKLWSLNEMERTGGEVDTIGYNINSGEYIFCDCSVESPKDRRSLCYDKKALESRKEHKPANNVIDMAASMGIDILTEEEYRELQKFGPFDMKTSSWIQTPSHIRELGGAIFADFRYGQVFIYHNGAESYYAARGFRGILKI